MILATLIVALGLTLGAWAATSRGYRLGGVVVVSLLAVYSLVDFLALPVFALSALIAYGAIKLVEARLLFYGRPLFLTGLLVGAAFPVVVFVGLDVLAGRPSAVSEMDYIGSILPGIAAYNVHREDAGQRVRDLVGSAVVYLTLAGVGIVSLLLWARPPCTTCQLFGVSPADYAAPILLIEGSDIAAALGLETVAGSPTLGSLGSVTLVILLGLAVSEVLRARWGLQPAGVIAVPLVALFALKVWWVLPLYVGLFAGTYIVVQALHRQTLLYGRALLSASTVLGVLLAVPVMVAFGLSDNVAVFFAGLLGGVGAYNLHTVSSTKRVPSVAVTAGSFVLLYAIARSLIEPLPGGLADTISAPLLGAAVILLAGAIWVLVGLERVRASEAALRREAVLPEEVSS